MHASDSNNDAPNDKAKNQIPLITPGPHRADSLPEKFGISPKTVRMWRENGLDAYRPQTKYIIVFGEDVAEYIRKFPVKPTEDDE